MSTLLLMLVACVTPDAACPVEWSALRHDRTVTSQIIRELRIDPSGVRRTCPRAVVFESAREETPWHLEFPGGGLSQLVSVADAADRTYRWLQSGTTLVVFPRDQALITQLLPLVSVDGNVGSVLASLAETYARSGKGRLILSVSRPGPVLRQHITLHMKGQPLYEVLAQAAAQAEEPFDFLGVSGQDAEGVYLGAAITFAGRSGTKRLEGAILTPPNAKAP